MKHLKRHLQVGALAVAVVALMGTWTPALAQPASQQKLIQKVSFGYKFYRVSASEADAVNYPIGFYVDASGDLRKLPGWDWIGEATYAHRSESDESFGITTDISENILFVGGGLKREFETNPSLIPHVQFLVGFARYSASFNASGGGVSLDDSFGETKFAIKISGGVDKPINDRWDVRGGAGYIRVFTEDVGTNIIRLFVGVVRRM